jgi:hypothetical protein
MMTLHVVQQNLHFLKQGVDLLRKLDDDTFARPTSDRPRAAGVGPHFRHCIDFYSCFLRDLASGRIDYDQRQRRPEIESRAAAAIAAIEEIIERLSAVGDDLHGRQIEVHHDEAPHEERTTAWHRTTVGRELRFLASHTVHHYALIAHLAREHGIDPGAEFGVAPATLEYWAAEVEA